MRARRMQYLDIPGWILYKLFKIPFFQKYDIVNKLPYRVREIIKNRDPEIKTQCGQGDMIERFHKLFLDEQAGEKFSVESQIPARRWDIKKMLLDMKYYIVDDILHKVDRASMRYALEVRCPMLDVNVITCSFHIPHKYKIYGRQTKKILRELDYEYIPRTLLDRPKMGFGAPVDQWLRGALKKDVIRVSRKDFLEKQGIFNPDNMRKFVDDYLLNGDGKLGEGKGYSYPVWAFYMFQLWWLKYYDVK
ncbi:MAG: asparagine synthase C-terminal domain-containing protein [Ruminococcus flavefaciens]|nr:asparagine synthase C-terminal domain-containing protein [Ruminococcus flavefaciens]